MLSQDGSSRASAQAKFSTSLYEYDLSTTDPFQSDTTGPRSGQDTIILYT